MNYAVNSTLFTTSITLMLLQAHLLQCPPARSGTKVTLFSVQVQKSNMALHRGLRTRRCSADTWRGEDTRRKKARVPLAIKAPDSTFHVSPLTCLHIQTLTHHAEPQASNTTESTAVQNCEGAEASGSEKLVGFFSPSPLQLLDTAGAFSTRHTRRREKPLKSLTAQLTATYRRSPQQEAT